MGNLLHKTHTAKQKINQSGYADKWQGHSGDEMEVEIDHILETLRVLELDDNNGIWRDYVEAIGPVTFPILYIKNKHRSVEDIHHIMGCAAWR